MRKIISLTLFGIFATAAITPFPPAQAAIYKWKDTNGLIHLTDTPPPPGASELQQPANVKTSPAATDTPHRSDIPRDPDTPLGTDTPRNPQAPATSALKSLPGPQPTEDDDHARSIERQLAAVKPAAVLSLSEANQALQRGIAAQGAKMEAAARGWGSAIRNQRSANSQEDTRIQEALHRGEQQQAKVRQALNSARVVRLDKCGVADVKGSSGLICDGEVVLTDTCGQTQHIRDLLTFQQQGTAWTAGFSVQALIKTMQGCAAGH